MRSQKLFKNKDAFTGLEAAIVLTAFIVVAAVFAYVVLGAGFFTTQKSKEVIHTGVKQTTSSLELTGSVIGHGWKYNASTNSNALGNWSYYYNSSAHYEHDLDSTNLTVVEFYLALTAGQNPVDANNLVLSYTDQNTHNGSISLSTSSNSSKANFTMPSWNYTIINGDGDNLIEFGEQVKIVVGLPDYGVTVNKEFTVEVKPASGATLSITRTAPPSIDLTMDLN